MNGVVEDVEDFRHVVGREDVIDGCGAVNNAHVAVLFEGHMFEENGPCYEIGQVEESKWKRHKHEHGVDFRVLEKAFWEMTVLEVRKNK